MYKFISLLLIANFLGLGNLQTNSQSNQSVPAAPTLVNGLITPEFLWGLGQVQVEAKSVDETSLLVSVKYTDVPNDSSFLRFFLLPVDETGKPQPIALPADASKPRFHPDGQHLFFLKKNYLHLFDLASKRIEKVSDFKIQEYCMSKEGTMVFTQKVKYGQTMLERHPDLKKANVKVFDALDARHWDSWHDEFRLNVFVAPYQLGMPLPAGKNIMENEPYNAVNISCSPDGASVLYEAKKVSANEQTFGTDTDVYLYHTQTGKTANLSEGMDGYDQNPVFSPNGSLVAWNSMATAGWETDRNRIFVHDLKTNSSREITVGFDYNANKPKWASDQTLIFSSEQQGTTQLFNINLEGEITRITQGKHTVDQFFVCGQTVCYAQSSFVKPTEIYQSRINFSGAPRQVTFVNDESLKNVRFGKFEERFTTTFDRKRLQSWVIYPPDFDPAKQYPVILYCQGGPQSPLNSQWGIRWSMQLLAAQGYIVIAPNRRGTFGWGTTWTKEISRNWERGNRDLFTAFDDFVKEPFVDKNRAAAVGGSFGGYSTFWLAGNHKGRFKCFISHCGLFNLESFYLTTDECFFSTFDMGEPFWGNPNNPTFTKFNPRLFVKNWDTPILIIQGGLDFRVPESEGFQAHQAAQIRGVKSRLLYFPTEGHWIQKPQHAVLWQREFVGWLGEHLK